MKEQYTVGERDSAVNVAKLKLMQSLLMERLWGHPVCDFALFTIRSCLRVEYHILNVYPTFLRELEICKQWGFEVGDKIQTNNDTVKFEVEAFLAASKTLLDIHPRDGMLERHLKSAPDLLEHFASVFEQYSHLFADGALINSVRNSTTHSKKSMRDAGYKALVFVNRDGAKLSLPYLFAIDGEDDIDIAELFCQAAVEINDFISKIVIAFAELVDVVRKQDRKFHLWYDSANWRVGVNYGPDGLECKSFFLDDLPERGQLVLPASP